LPKFDDKLPCDLASLREKKCVQARFLLGPAGSGKTFRCLAEIRAALAASPAGPPLVLLAPKQATFQLERQLLATGALPGYARLNIFSFERLAQFVLDALGVPMPSGLLAEEGRVMVLRALLMRHESELKLFRPSARRPGFAQQLSQLLGELQQHQFTAAKLRVLAQRPGPGRELQHKLHDLALLLDAYTNWLAKHELQDGNRLLDAATDALRSAFDSRPSTLDFHSLWLDGFAEMTPQELDLLAGILPHCDRATLAFCLAREPEADASWLSIWSSIGKTFQQCRRRMAHLPDCEISVEILKRNPLKSRFAGNPVLQHLEQGWPQPTQNQKLKTQNSVRMVACTNPETEAAFAAREILEFVQGGGRFRDCAVLVRNLDGYHRPLGRGFRRYGIPFFLDRRESVAHHPLAGLTRSALRTVVSDWSPDDWFAALKAGFSSVDETEVDRLENESLARGWRGAKWREPFHLPENPELATSLERLRKKILPPFENFAAQLARHGNQPTGGQLAEILRDLWNDLKVESTLERWSLADPGHSPPAPRPSSLHLTVWEQMNAWLANVALAFPDEALPLREWLPVLEAGLANLTVGVIPPALDQVLIGAIDRARSPDLKLVLVLGVNEAVFPAAPAAPVILTETDREELGRHGAAPGPDLRERLARERYLGYIACTRASERLVVTFSRHDADGRTLNSSPFIAQLRRIFPDLEVGEFNGEVRLDEAEHVSEIAPRLVEMQAHRESRIKTPLPAQRGEGRGAGRVENWDELLQLPALVEWMENLRALREPDPAERLSPALAEKLFGPTLRSSVSRLEAFAQCPFRFFVHSGLRAEERKVFELDAREQGSFQHEVLKMFHEQLSAEAKRWRDITPSDARELVSKIAAVLALNYRDGLLRADGQSRFTARVLAESLQDFVETLVAWMHGQYEFDPAVAELEFGIGDSGAPAWEINLGTGLKLALRGRIDRIDLCRETGDRALCVVMDYKSSRRKLDKILVEHGVQLQLLAYLAAIRSWPPEVWAGLNLPAFFSLSSLKKERAGERRPIVSKSKPLAPALFPLGRGEGEKPKLFGVQQLIPTGVFYVNLRGQYESGGTRDEALADADGARKRAYRHTGRFDAGALSRLDRVQAADQFNYQLNKDGRLRSDSVEALPRAEFEKLLDRVEAQLQEMGRAIFFGTMPVDPYRKGREMPCEHCDYRAACRIDPWTHQYRVLRPSAEKVFDNSRV
jgi:ATP-dependent helicase/nuclease subunit B